MDIHETPSSTWDRHGNEWEWDQERQLLLSPYPDVPDAAGAGSIPEELHPTYGAPPNWAQQETQDL